MPGSPECIPLPSIVTAAPNRRWVAMIGASFMVSPWHCPCSIAHYLCMWCVAWVSQRELASSSVRPPLSSHNPLALQLALLLWMNMVPSLGLVVEWLDQSTLGLLFGMMIIVGRLKDTVRGFQSSCNLGWAALSRPPVSGRRAARRQEQIMNVAGAEHSPDPLP